MITVLVIMKSAMLTRLKANKLLARQQIPFTTTAGGSILEQI